jgi:hypothetical protein
MKWIFNQLMWENKLCKLSLETQLWDDRNFGDKPLYNELKLQINKTMSTKAHFNR